MFKLNQLVALLETLDNISQRLNETPPLTTTERSTLAAALDKQTRIAATVLEGRLKALKRAGLRNEKKTGRQSPPQSISLKTSKAG